MRHEVLNSHTFLHIAIIRVEHGCMNYDVSNNRCPLTYHISQYYYGVAILTNLHVVYWARSANGTRQNHKNIYVVSARRD